MARVFCIDINALQNTQLVWKNQIRLQLFIQMITGEMLLSLVEFVK